VLEQHLEGDTWMAYDANSGGHATQTHARSLRGYTIVNPHAAVTTIGNLASAASHEKAALANYGDSALNSL